MATATGSRASHIGDDDFIGRRAVCAEDEGYFASNIAIA